MAPWYDATQHVLIISAATDASSRGWGGLIRGLFGAFFVFKAAADIPAAWHNAPINVKETFALHEVLKLATTTHSGCLKGSTAVVDVDNKPMHDAFKKGRSRNTQTHDLITKLFWLQVKEDFTLELRWVCSEANWAADSLTRLERTEHVRLSQAAYDRLWETWGGGVGDMHLVIPDTSAQYAPIEGGLERQRLPFHSRFHANNTAWVDVFSHNVSHMPGSLQNCFSYCFPQPSLVGVVLAHISKYEARAVIVVPNTRASWFPMIEGAGVRSVQIASQGTGSQFFRVHHQRGAEPHTFAEEACER